MASFFQRKGFYSAPETNIFQLIKPFTRRVFVDFNLGSDLCDVHMKLVLLAWLHDYELQV
jgi:hypothetical protein